MTRETRSKGGIYINADHKKIDLTFGRRLNQLMIERGLYPKDIQRMTGVRRQNIYQYVQGVKQPSAYNVKRIARGLNVSADWLLGIEKNE